MKLESMNVAEIIPYENNPRINDAAVEAVAESIRQCSYVAPIVVDENNVILAGHTRLKALQKLGIDIANVVRAEGLTEEQKRKYRLLDNKTGEVAEWDFDKLLQELDGMNFDGFDFGFDNLSLDSDGGDGDEPPEEFKEYGDDIPTKNKCPKCGYEW